MSNAERYALGEAIARGGMGTVHLGRLVGSAGFARTVAIKRIHPHLVSDKAIAESFTAEARLAARIRHPNVVPTLDVVESASSGVLLVMEYVDGDSLASLLRASRDPIPLPISVAIVSAMLHGLHSAHEARSEAGEPLEIVHRDVSPQNVLVGADGVARLVDFGIARAANEAGTTDDGEIKGKLAYMAPEQIRRERATRRIDIFAAGIVLWELLTGKRLFAAEHPGATLEKILVGWVAAPSSIVRDLPPAFDEIALRALDPDPENRFATAREMATALEDAMRPALGREVAAWVEARAGENLVRRRAQIERFEAGASEPRLPPRPSLVAEETTHVMWEETSVQGVVFGATSPGSETSAPKPRRRALVPVALVALATAATVLVNAVRPHPVASSAAAPPPAEVTYVPVETAMPATRVIAPPPAETVKPVDPPKPPARKAPPPARARRACIAKVDPVTQKRVYQGDCD